MPPFMAIVLKVAAVSCLALVTVLGTVVACRNLSRAVQGKPYAPIPRWMEFTASLLMLAVFPWALWNVVVFVRSHEFRSLIAPGLLALCLFAGVAARWQSRKREGGSAS